MPVTIGKLGIVRLDGDDLTALRAQRFVMDKFRCTDCGRRVALLAPDWSPTRAHLAHVVSRGAGGSDTIENTRTKCGDCHMVGEHNPRSVRAKEAL